MKVSSTPINLNHFIANIMGKPHIYQPVMIKASLGNGSQATTAEIAKYLIAYD